MAVDVRGGGLSFVLPFWNEIDGAEAALEAVAQAATDMTDRGVLSSVEIIAVDDGSTDGTGDLLRRLRQRDERIRDIHRPQNGGLGAALRSGFSAASEDWIFYTDGDLPVDPFVAERALRAAGLHQADIVSCYRLDRTGEGTRRAVLSAAYNTMVRAVTGLAVRDVNFAAKLVRRSFAVEAMPISDSLFFDAELLARAVRNGALIQQIGVDYFPRTVGTSTLSSPRVIQATVRDLMHTGPGLRVRS